MRFCTVVYGASTISSWSIPMLLYPLGVRVPMTLSGILLNRITFPIGLSPLGKRLSVMVFPIKQTLAEVMTSCGVNMLPSSKEILRISR